MSNITRESTFISSYFLLMLSALPTPTHSQFPENATSTDNFSAWQPFPAWMLFSLLSLG
jgi:hypothetical protein